MIKKTEIIKSEICKTTKNSKGSLVSGINKKFGKFHTETTNLENYSSRLITRLKDEFNHELGKEDFSYFSDSLYGLSIEVKPEYKEKGYGFGEILRLSSIIMILENKIKEFLIYSLPSAIFFHSKYKFQPSIEKMEDSKNILRNVIKNCNQKLFGDIHLEAEKILTECEQCNTYEESKVIFEKTNKLLEKYITRIMNFGNDYKLHPFDCGMHMKLTLDDIFYNKDFFNNLFDKHGIDYHI